MRRLILVMSLLGVLSGMAEARIGENREQIEARYGKPASEGPLPNGMTLCVFRKDRFQISCYLKENKVVAIEYKKDKQMEDDEVKTLLEKNSDGSPWDKKSIYQLDLNKQEYVSEKLRLEATYSILKKSLLISSQEVVNERNEKKKKDMEGF